jgi:hypothetical protein
MVDGRATGTPLIDFRVVALYPGRLAAVSGKPGVRFRRRKRQESTLVPCRINTIDGRSFAAPEYHVPEGTPSPMYRAQVELVRLPVDDRHVVYVVLSAEPQASRMDPEQVVLSPIFDDGHRMIFEFQRAQILSVTRRGDLETRLIAVHPVLGVVGTQTLHRFNTRFCAIATRCMEHIGGAVDLFPQRPQTQHARRMDIPVGEANLTFDSAANLREHHERTTDPWAAIGPAAGGQDRLAESEER